MRQKIRVLRLRLARSRRIVGIAFLIMAGSSQLSYGLTISDVATIETSLGRAYELNLDNLVPTVRMEMPGGKEKLERRCETVDELLADGVMDLQQLRTLVLPSPFPELRVGLPMLAPEAEPLWESVLEDLASSADQELRGMSTPYRPRLLSLTISLSAEDEVPAEATVIVDEITSNLNEAFLLNKDFIQQNGFFLFPVQDPVFPCMILNNEFNAHIDTLLRSFDLVTSTRLFSESEVDSLVRDTEAQIAKDSHQLEGREPPLEALIAFRSIEAIGHLFNWADVEKALIWPRFVEEWATRLSGSFRPLTDDDLDAVSRVLTLEISEPVLLQASETDSSVEVVAK